MKTIQISITRKRFTFEIPNIRTIWTNFMLFYKIIFILFAYMALLILIHDGRKISVVKKIQLKSQGCGEILKK